MAEIWREIAGYTMYEVSSLGRLRRAGTHEEIQPWLNSHKPAEGYWRVQLYRYVVNGHRERHRKLFYVHRLVATAFCERAEKRLTQVHHIDSDPSNNRADNLMWVTRADNLRYRYKRMHESILDLNVAPF